MRRAFLGIGLTLGLMLAAAAQVRQSPYAGEQTQEIKALSADERAALLAGKGMGYAKAAELNGYPGPAHVIELAAELRLSPEQLSRSRDIFGRMQQSAQSDGAALIDAERALDTLYAKRTATEATVAAALVKIETIRTHLRGVHLNAHLEQTAVLTVHQLARYAELRGYSADTHRGH